MKTVEIDLHPISYILIDACPSYFVDKLLELKISSPTVDIGVSLSAIIFVEIITLIKIV